MFNKRAGSMGLLALASFFVVWGHHFTHAANRYVFSFHVAFLFFVAGALEEFNQEESPACVGKRLAKRILVPYLAYSFVLYAIWLGINAITGNASGKGLSVVQNFIGIFYSQGMSESMDWGLHMWFFPCLFVTSLLSLLLMKFVKSSAVMIIASIALVLTGAFIHVLFPVSIPWSIDVALVGVPFFLFGYKIRDFNFVSIPLFVKWVSVPFLFGIGFWLQQINQRIDMKQHLYGNIFLFVLSASSSILFYYLIARSLEKWKPAVFIGAFFTPIFVFHMRLWSFMQVALRKFAPALNDSGMLNAFFFSALQIAIIVCGTIVTREIIRVCNAGKKV